MIIIYGTGTFGPVDELEGIGRVETRFAHLMFTPIIPLMQSYLVLDDDDDHGERRAVPVPLSHKSIACAWIRAVAFWAGLAGLVIAVARAADGSWVGAIAYFALSVAGFLAFLAVGALMARCSPARRAQLLAYLGIEDSAARIPGARQPSYPPTGRAASYPPAAHPSYPPAVGHALQPPPAAPWSYPPAPPPAHSAYPPAITPPAGSAAYPAYPPSHGYAAPPPDLEDDATTVWSPEATELHPLLSSWPPRPPAPQQTLLSAGVRDRRACAPTMQLDAEQIQRIRQSQPALAYAPTQLQPAIDPTK